ncbi:hypothetical protein JW826_04950 [Candidatus Woesearchaeota archaeon]|nr:hypothetical protein [Candidatus Woesearchaeota archaeon]
MGLFDFIIETFADPGRFFRLRRNAHRGGAGFHHESHEIKNYIRYARRYQSRFDDYAKELNNNIDRPVNKKALIHSMDGFASSVTEEIKDLCHVMERVYKIVYNHIEKYQLRKLEALHEEASRKYAEKGQSLRFRHYLGGFHEKKRKLDEKIKRVKDLAVAQHQPNLFTKIRNLSAFSSKHIERQMKLDYFHLRRTYHKIEAKTEYLEGRVKIPEFSKIEKEFKETIDLVEEELSRIISLAEHTMTLMQRIQDQIAKTEKNLMSKKPKETDPEDFRSVFNKLTEDLGQLSKGVRYKIRQNAEAAISLWKDVKLIN